MSPWIIPVAFGVVAFAAPVVYYVARDLRAMLANDSLEEMRREIEWRQANINEDCRVARYRQLRNGRGK